MSRSKEEWNEARSQAIRVRRLIYRVIDANHELDYARFSEIDHMQHNIGKRLEAIIPDVDKMIGRLTLDPEYWGEETA